MKRFSIVFLTALVSLPALAAVEVFVPGEDNTIYDNLSIVGVNDSQNPGRIEDGKMKGLFLLLYHGMESWTTQLTSEPTVETVGGKILLKETNGLLDFRFSFPVEINAKSPALKVSGMGIQRLGNTTIVTLNSDRIGVSASESRVVMGEFSGATSGVAIDRVTMEFPNLGMELEERFLLQDTTGQRLVFGIANWFGMRLPLSSETEGCGFQVAPRQNVLNYDINGKRLFVTRPDSSNRILGFVQKWRESSGATHTEQIRIYSIEFFDEEVKILGENSQCYCADLSPSSTDTTCSVCPCD